jgi:hypothetical protein
MSFAQKLSPQGLTLQGRIIKPDGTVLESASVAFTVEVRSPDPDDCLLYSEQFTLNMTGSSGIFSFNAGTGTRSASGFANTSTLAQVFNNSRATAITPLTCTSGATSYQPASTHKRVIKIGFDDGATGFQYALQTLDVQAVPYAMYADTLEGKAASEFIQVNTAGGKALSQANLESVFQSSAYVTELLALINGTSTQYATSSAGTNFNFGAGKFYVDGTSGNVGIGTATPSKLLDITQSQNAATSLLVTNANAGASAQATLGTTSDSGSTTMSSVSTAGGGYGRVVSTSPSLALDAQNASGFLSFRTGAAPTERMRIDSSGNVGIGTTNPIAKLDVNGGINIKGVNGINYPASDTTTGASIAIGPNALVNQPGSAAYSNIGIGYGALSNSGMTTSAINNTVIGYQTGLNSSSGNNNVYLGYQAGKNATTASDNVVIGYQAGLGSISGSGNILIGSGVAGASDTAAVVAIGLNADFEDGGCCQTVLGSYAVTSGNSTAVGFGAKSKGGGGFGGVSFGANAGDSGGADNVIIGGGAGSTNNLIGAYNTILGSGSGTNITSGTNNLILGYNIATGSLSSGTHNILIGTSSSVDTPASNTNNFLNIGNVIFATGMTGTLGAPAGNVGIGTTAPAGILDVRGGTATAGNATDVNVYAQNGATSGNTSGGHINLIPGAGNGAGGGGAVNIIASGAYPLAAGSSSSEFTSFSLTNWSTGGRQWALVVGGQNQQTGNFVIRDETGSSNRLVINSTGSVGIGTSSPSVTLDLGSRTDALRLPNGTTAQQPASPAEGLLRYNTNGGTPPGWIEFYNGSAWVNLIGSTTGGNLTNIGNITGSGSVTLAPGGTTQPLNLSNPTGGAVNVTTSAGNVVLQPGGVGIVTVPNTTVSNGTTSGALVVGGGVGIAGAISAGSTIAASGAISSGTSLIAPALYGATTASQNLTIDSTSNATKGNVFIAPSGGNVGIGTTSPGAALDVANGTIRATSSTTYPVIEVYGSSTNSFAPAFILKAARSAGTAYPQNNDQIGVVGFRNQNNNQSGAIQAYASENQSATASGGRLIFTTTPTGTVTDQVRMTITDSGNVGIGTSSPSKPLEVVGDVQVSSTVANGYNSRLTLNPVSGNWSQIYGDNSGNFGVFMASTNTPFQINSNASNRVMTIDSGNVGIGTSAPGAPLDVYGSAQPLTAVNGILNLSSSSVQGAGVGASMALGGYDGTTSRTFATFGGFKENATSGNYAGYLAFATRANGASPAERMRIDSSGNVGIGTTTPKGTLHVVASSGGTSSVGADFLVQNDGGGGNQAWVAIMGGGTGGAGIDFGTRSGTPGSIYYDNGSNSMRFSSNSAEALRITSSGNVGIGTTSPSNTLHVVGSMCVKSAAGACAGTTAGTIYATATTITSADLAERMPVEDQSLHAGEVVSIERSPASGQAIFSRSKSPYQANATGVISTNPGVELGSDTGASRPVALAGRVPVNVSVEGGPIAIGDYLVASSTPGRAMKAASPTTAGVIGIALSAYNGQPIAAQNWQDGIAHEKGHQVLMLVQPGANAQSGLMSLKLEKDKEIEYLKAQNEMLNARLDRLEKLLLKSK